MTDSTDPGAVTHLDAYKALQAVWRVAIDAPELLTLKAYIDQQESALIAMTARAEAAEAALAKLSTKVGAIRDALGAFDGAASYAHRQELRFPLMLAVRALFESAAKPHGIDLATYLTAEAERDGACHKCGKQANVNDGDDGMGPPVCVDCYDAEWSDPAPQLAAAPKVLPVEELRREMLLQRDDLIDGLQVCDTLADLANHLIQRRADRLERGGEGKGDR